MARTKAAPETEADKRDRILNEIDSGLRKFSKEDSRLLEDYGAEEDLMDDDDDDDAIDAGRENCHDYYESECLRCLSQQRSASGTKGTSGKLSICVVFETY